MFIVNNYLLAVVLCFVTMLCWGSWANTQKLAGKTWRYELFYWDYVIGILLFSIFLGLTFTTAVDYYPNGKSAYGCFDMAGNSWDWTSSEIVATNGLIRDFRKDVADYEEL